MKSAPKVSSCADCPVPVIGGGKRCPACRAQHAARIASIREAVLVWLCAIVAVSFVVAFMLSLVRSCQ